MGKLFRERCYVVGRAFVELVGVITVVVRLDGNGNIDESFSAEGILDVGGASKLITFAPNGDFLLAGGIEIKQFRSDGSPALAFGDAGVVTTTLNAGYAYPEELLVLPDGTLILAATTAYDPADGKALARIVGSRDGLPAWQNPTLVADVNHDGIVAPVDALIVINNLNAHGPRALPAYRVERISSGFLDVNGDGAVTPVDALIVINRLNSLTGQVAESESVKSLPITSNSAALPHERVAAPNRWPTQTDAILTQLAPNEANITQMARDSRASENKRRNAVALVEELFSDIDITRASPRSLEAAWASSSMRPSAT